MRDYTKIDAWKLADDLTVAIYERTRTFPKETGKVSTAIAKTTSVLTLSLANLFSLLGLLR